jgi:hypothetical protein
MYKEQFWMVLGAGTPNCQHLTLDSAKKEAERLARLNPGQAFTVLQSIATVVKSDVKWEVHDDDGVIPF